MDGLTMNSPIMDWESPDLESSWKRFWEHCKFVFNGPLKKKEEEEKCNYLMIWVGEKGRKIYQTWEMSDDEKKLLKSYTDNFEKYVKPRSNIVYNRYRFSSRIQNDDETFDQFVTDLQILVKDCSYDKPDEMVRDRVVFGVRNNKVREKFINIGSDLTLEKTLDIARAYEISKSQTKSMELSETEKVNIVKNGARPKSKRKFEKTGTCSRCGKTHTKDKCPAIGEQCSKCKKYNHFAAVCKTKNVPKRQERYKRREKKVHTVESDSESDNDFYIGVVKMSDGGNINTVNKHWLIETEIGGHSVKMNLDTGAHCNVMSIETLKKVGLKGCDEKSGDGNTQILRSYSGHKIPVTGTRLIDCKIKGQIHSVRFHIVKKPAETILGYETCEELNLVKRVYTMLPQHREVEKDFPKLFSGLGKLPGQHRITLNETVTPVVHPPRKTPFALREKIKKELESMERQNVIVKQDEPTDWVNSMVTVVKPNGKLRICMDPKDLNKAIKREHYPMKTIEEILPLMSNAQIFSKLDASCGFWQCELDEQSQKLCTMNTPLGRYSFRRLPYGIKSAPEVYQKLISTMVQDIEGCESIIDDIVIWGSNREEHDERLYKVLLRINDNNLRLNKAKCEFRKTEISFVGHTLTNKGLKPDEEKVRAVRGMKKPENVKELMTFLGFVNYLGKFIKNLSEKSEPLRKLLQKNIQWHWEKEQEEAYECLKESIIKAPVLKYYDQSQPITLQVDASQGGLGAVILQNEQPVAYGSRALTNSQRNYAQIEKEALAILYGCTKFHQYVFGKEVLVETDHRPLQSIFAKPLHQAPPRLQRILLSLQRYDLNVKFKPGKEMYISDCLSRAYLDETKEDLGSEELSINLLTYLPVSEEKRREFQEATENDEEMNILRKVVEQGWPDKQELIPGMLKPYWNYRDEITCIDGMLFKGHKLIIPKKLRPEMLLKVHEAHTGIVKCKSRARETLFWPGMVQEVENHVSKCEICAVNQNKNPKEPLIKTELPDRPWAVIGVDLFAFRGNNYLITVDKYSSWPEIAKLDNLSSENTITYMKSQFSRYGIPDKIYSDNGPQFASESFKKFAKDYGFLHTTSSPMYPQSNGLAERGVQTVKSLLKKAKDPYMSIMIYRDTIINPIGLSPAQMFLGRRLKTTLPVTSPLLKPNQHTCNADVVQSRKEYSQMKQKSYFDKHCGKEQKYLEPGDKVLMRREQSTKWEPAIVVSKHSSPRSYVLEKKNGQTYRRNRKHIRPTKANITESDQDCADIQEKVVLEQCKPSDQGNLHTEKPSMTRSGRVVKMPAKYDDFQVGS